MVEPITRLDDLIEQVDAALPHGTALQRLGESVGLSDHLGQLADHLVGHFVDQARQQSATWAEIGNALGVTKQAAQKRFVSRRAIAEIQQIALGADRGESVFGRFTHGASAVVIRAQEHASHNRHAEIGTGHILLALLDDPRSVAVRALAAQRVWPEKVRDAVRGALEPGRGGAAKHYPFAADAKKVLELALREALRMKCDHIGPEHILLALVRDEKSLGARILADFGVGRGEVERAMAR